MSCAIVAIGNELLAGRVVNSNAAWMSRQLQQAGYRVDAHFVLPDEETALQNALAPLIKTYDCILITGGLGPTLDDLTRQIVAKLLNKKLVPSQEVFKSLKSRYGDALVSIENQSLIISDATVLPNQMGTAPGQLIKSDQAYLVLLPGVPHEMQALMLEQVLPQLIKLLPPNHPKEQIAIHAFQKTESSIDPLLRQVQERYPAVSCGIYPGLGVITLLLSTEDSTSDLNLAANMLKSQLAPYWFEAEGGTVEEAVHKLFQARGWTLSCAESFTGGSVAAKLTRLPGSSQVFLGGVIAYDNAVKERLLDVSPESLASYGAVSSQVAAEMAEGALKRINSTFALATTGVAGPGGGSLHKPVGTAWIAIARQGYPTQTKQLQLHGSREIIMTRATNILLGELLLVAQTS